MEVLWQNMSERAKNIDWERVAAALNERLAGRLFHPAVEAVLERNGVRRILVACSGGADSVLMLCLLKCQVRALGLELSVAHYNHRWRAEASVEDAVFVELIADAMGLTYYYGERPAKQAAFTETTARALRLEFLRQAAVDASCEWIAFGHQLDDILETQLQRVGRGSGSDGLAAPRPISHFPGRPSHIRPLLHLRSGEVRMLLNSYEVPWCCDTSNADMLIARNALRHRIIPELSEALGRDAPLGAARTRSLLEEDATALSCLARERLPDAFSNSLALPRAQLREAPRALTRRALTEWLSVHDLLHSMSAAGVDLLLDTVYSDRETHRISAGKSYIVLEKDLVRVDRSVLAEGAEVIEPSDLIVGNSVILSTGNIIQTALVSLSAEQRASILRGGVDQSIEAFVICQPEDVLLVRGWLPGDRFRPIGAPGTKKLKDWFIDRRIPQKERKFIPLVVSSSREVIWVPGFPPAESMKIKRDTKVALRLTYQDRNPI